MAKKINGGGMGAGRGGRNNPPGGRPPEISDTIHDAVVKSLSSGNYVDVACNYAGIHRSTFYEWVKRGSVEAERRRRAKPLDQLAPEKRDKELARRRAEDPYFRFSDAVKKAQADAEVRALALIQGAGSESWQAVAWFLERKFPDRWGARRKVEVEIAGEVRKQLDLTLDKLEEAVNRGEIDARTYDTILAILSEVADDDGGSGPGAAGET